MRLLLAALALTSIVFAGETIRLGGGKSLHGEVVKETGDTVFLDLGYTIVGVPKKEILERVPDAKAGAAHEGGEAVASKDALYSTIDRPETSVKENVDRVGGAVVKITSPGGLGSGFIITPDGYIVTNDHVIQGERRLTVTLFKPKKNGGFEKENVEKVKIVALNPYADLALLKLEGEKGLPIAYLGESDDLRVGQPVFAIGNPLGLERSVSQGIISTLSRPFDGLTYLQTTTAINPGNSGGPLFDLKGQVVGVTNMGYMFTEGLNFAIPVDAVKRFLKHRDAFSFDKDNPNTGYRYLPPPPKVKTPAPDSEAGRTVSETPDKGS